MIVNPEPQPGMAEFPIVLEEGAASDKKEEGSLTTGSVVCY